MIHVERDDPARAERISRIRTIVEECLGQQALGRTVDVLDLLASHPELPELAGELRKIALVRRAAARAERESDTRDANLNLPDDNGSSVGIDVSTPPNRVERDMPPRGAFAGYEIVRRIGHGGQGVVFEAVQLATKRQVAIKALLDGRFASPAVRKRFLREIRLAGQLRHPGIAQVMHAGATSDGRLYSVMELCNGQPLNEFIRRQRSTLREALTLFADVCDAVHFAHEHGVVHRDLKPSNILVGEGIKGSRNQGIKDEGTAPRTLIPRSLDPSIPQPKVLDFGLATAATTTIDSATATNGAMLGTLAYMAPEQATDQPGLIDVRTDVYALGVILFELLTGGFPYPVEGSPIDVVRNIAERSPVSPRSVWTAETGVCRGRGLTGCPLGEEICTIVAKALCKERDRRYASAAELRDDILRYLAGKPITAKRDSLSYRLRKWASRNRTGVCVGGVVLTLATTTLLAWSAAETAREQSIRDHWVMVLHEARGRGLPELAPSLEVQEAIEGVWSLLRARRADLREMDALAAYSVRYQIEERKLISRNDKPFGREHIQVRRFLGWAPPGCQIAALSCMLTLDGANPIQAADRPVATVQFQTFHCGSHTIAGGADVRFLDVAQPRNGAAPRELGRAEAPADPFLFTAIERTPADYPTLVDDPEYSDRLAGGVACRAGFVTRPMASSVTGFSDRLRIECDIPRPMMDVALRLSVTADGVDYQARFPVAFEFDPQAGGRASAQFGTSTIGVDASGDIWHCWLETPTCQVSGQCNPNDLLGARLHVQAQPARVYARFYTRCEHFQVVQFAATAVVEDRRVLPYREAAMAYYGALADSFTPWAAREALAGQTGLDNAVRGVALAMADEASDPKYLSQQAFFAVQRPGRDTQAYARALEMAQASVDAVSDDFLAHQALGITLFRLGQDAAARAEFELERYYAGFETAPMIALDSMARFRLGDVEGACGELNRLRGLRESDIAYELNGDHWLPEAAAMIDPQAAAGPG